MTAERDADLSAATGRLSKAEEFAEAQTAQRAHVELLVRARRA